MMKTEILKLRSKRLRAAITEMFGVPVTVAQALELVAKEENFPNWDAAAACVDKVGAAAGKPADAVVSLPGKGCDLGVDEIFAAEPALIDGIRKRFVIESNTGAFFVCAGGGNRGKTTAMHAVVSDMRRRYAGNEFCLLHIGQQEQRYPDGIQVQTATIDSIFQKLTEGEFEFDPQSTPVVVIDEIRRGESAYVAVTLANFGFKVLTTIHAGGTEMFLHRMFALMEELHLLRSGQYADDGRRCLHRLLGDNLCYIAHRNFLPVPSTAITESYWVGCALMLAAELKALGSEFVVSATDAEIAGKAGEWFGALGGNEKSSIIATMREIAKGFL